MVKRRALLLLWVGAALWSAACAGDVADPLEPELSADYICDPPPPPGDDSPPVMADCYWIPPPPPYVPPPEGDPPPDGGGGDNPGEPADCNTSDPIVNSLGSGTATMGFHALWNASYPNEPMMLRREMGGWIVRTSDGRYEIVLWKIQGTVCGIDGNVGPMPTWGTVVAFIHTHPYRYGESVPVCDQYGNPTTTMVPYSSIPSNEDLKMSATLGLPGYILDGDWVSTHTATKGKTFAKRCGY